MPRTLAVFGATGQQGGSVARFVLSSMPDKFQVRAITRNASSPAAVALSGLGADIAVADLDDPSSLESAVAGADTVFAITVTKNGQPDLLEAEVAQGRAIADACVKQGVHYLIWSTAVDAASVVKEYRVDMMQAKFEVERYIRSLPIRSSFYFPGSFMQNYQTVYQFFPQPDGSFVSYTVYDADSELPLVDINDTDKFIEPILLNPDKYEGKLVAGFSRFYSFREVEQILSEKTGKTVRFVKVSDEAAGQNLPEALLNMFRQFRDYGYYLLQGEELQKQSEWWLAQPRRKPTTLEEYLDRNPLKLE